MAYEHLMEKLEDELEALDKKVAQGHDLEKDEYECAKTWSKTLVSLQTKEAMDEEYGDDEEYEASYRNGKRDSMGRYSRNGRGGSYRRTMYPYPMYPSYRGNSRRGNGYSYHDGEDDPMAKLQEAYDNATSEQERKTIRKLMEQMED